MVYFAVCSVFDFFHQHLTVFGVQVFCLLRYVYFYVFYSFDAVVNGIVYLISLSDVSFFMYRNAAVFCVLILYSATY